MLLYGSLLCGRHVNAHYNRIELFLTVSDHDNRGGADPYIHLHKEQLARSAVLFGVGVLKGAVITTLLNNANNNNGGGITIGKK